MNFFWENATKLSKKKLLLFIAVFGATIGTQSRAVVYVSMDPANVRPEVMNGGEFLFAGTQSAVEFSVFVWEMDRLQVLFEFECLWKGLLTD